MFIYLDSDPIANWSIIFVSNLPANMYSESRGEACDFARVRNACFEQVIFLIVALHAGHVHLEKSILVWHDTCF